MGGGGLIPWCSLVCYEKLKSATIALIFPCHQYNAREKWAKYSQPYVQTHCVRNLDFVHKTFVKCEKIIHLSNIIFDVQLEFLDQEKFVKLVA